MQRPLLYVACRIWISIVENAHNPYVSLSEDISTPKHSTLLIIEKNKLYRNMQFQKGPGWAEQQWQSAWEEKKSARTIAILQFLKSALFCLFIALKCPLLQGFYPIYLRFSSSIAHSQSYIDHMHGNRSVGTFSRRFLTGRINKVRFMGVLNQVSRHIRECMFLQSRLISSYAEANRLPRVIGDEYHQNSFDSVLSQPNQFSNVQTCSQTLSLDPAKQPTIFYVCSIVPSLL